MSARTLEQIGQALYDCGRDFEVSCERGTADDVRRADEKYWQLMAMLRAHKNGVPTRPVPSHPPESGSMTRGG